jgi:hypothetical protein
MILFDLVCTGGHRFESWFRNSATYDSQTASGEVSCPVCGDVKLKKALTAPSLVTRRSRSSDQPAALATPSATSAPALGGQAAEALAKLRAHVESHFEYVGERFPEEARRIHYGETDARAIYGEATAEEGSALIEEGVDFIAVPWPVRRDS